MYEKIVAVLAGQLQVDPNKITEDTDIAVDLGADSLDVVEILMELEQEFGLTIPDEEIVKFRTPKDILVYVQENKSAE